MVEELDRGRRACIVLIANDQEWVPRSLESILIPEGFEVVRAYTGRQALDKALAVRPDLIVLDQQMPDLDGFEVCRRLRANSQINSVTPIVITTAGPASRERRLEAFSAGAWAFYSQPFDSELLLAQFRTFLASKAAYEAARSQMLVDSLTGLYSAAGMAQRAREIGSEAHRRQQPLACVVFGAELNGGRPDEETIRDLARRIGAVFHHRGRSADAIGRVGALTFAVVAPGTDSGGALKMARRFESAVLETAKADGGLDHLRLLAGYCAVPNFSKSDADAVEMLSRASAALSLAAPEEPIRAA